MNSLNENTALTTHYFEEILQKYNNDGNLRILSIKLWNLVESNGDAFASTMFRVEVFANQNHDLKHGTFIVKMLPASEIAREKLGSGNYDVHEKEMEVFQKILPQLREILRTNSEDENVFPKAIAVDRKRGIIVLEDLSLKKFVMADRKIGLDSNHIKLSLKKLAKFHAVSMVLIEEDPKALEKFDIGMFSRQTSAFNSFFCGNMNALTSEVSSWKGYEEYAKKLEAMKTNLLENACKVFDNEPGDIKSLIHGDFWTNNVMFKYDQKGEVDDAMILDFQFCCVAHPAVDLLYFLYTSSDHKTRQVNIFDFTQFYYYELKSVLGKMNHDVQNFPTLHQFQLQVMKKYFYAFPATLVILPLMMTDDPESCFENAHETGEKSLAFRRRIYKNPNLQQIIAKSLPEFDRLGLLDEI